MNEGPISGAAPASDIGTNPSVGASDPISLGGGAPAEPAAPVLEGDAFRSALGDFAGNPALKDVNDVPTLAKRFLDNHKMAGSKGLALPGEDATPEQWAEFNKSMGVPEAPEGYEFKTPENWPENVPYDEELRGAYAKTAHEIGLRPDQAAKLQEWFDNRMIESMGKMAEQAQMSDAEFEAEAKKRWGENVKPTLDAASQAFIKYGSESDRDALQNLPNDQLIAVASIMANMRKEMGAEDSPAAGNGAGNATSISNLEDMRKRADAIMTDPVYRQPMRDPEKSSALKTELREIYKKIDAMERGQ